MATARRLAKHLATRLARPMGSRLVMAPEKRLAKRPDLGPAMDWLPVKVTVMATGSGCCCRLESNRCL